MTIIQLEYLLAVANTGSFSAGAELCFVTQPSLSVQIRNLEEELGVVLLDRTKKPVIPTEIGKVVIENARKALKAFEYIKESVNEVRSEVAGTLRLGMIPTIAPYLIPQLLPMMAERYPKVELEVVVIFASEIFAELSKDALDAAVVSSGTCPSSLIEHELANDRFFAYLSPQHDMIERASLRLEDVNAKELLLLSDKHCLRDQVIELCHLRRNPRTAYNVHCNSLETLMRLVDTTPTMTIIPEMAIPGLSPERRKQVKTLAKGAASRKIAVVVRRTYVKKTIITALEKCIVEVCNSAKKS